MNRKIRQAQREMIGIKARQAKGFFDAFLSFSTVALANFSGMGLGDTKHRLHNLFKGLPVSKKTDFFSIKEKVSDEGNACLEFNLMCDIDGLEGFPITLSVNDNPIEVAKNKLRLLSEQEILNLNPNPKPEDLDLIGLLCKRICEIISLRKDLQVFIQGRYDLVKIESKSDFIDVEATEHNVGYTGVLEYKDDQVVGVKSRDNCRYRDRVELPLTKNDHWELRCSIENAMRSISLAPAKVRRAFSNINRRNDVNKSAFAEIDQGSDSFKVFLKHEEDWGCEEFKINGESVLLEFCEVLSSAGILRKQIKRAR